MAISDDFVRSNVASLLRRASRAHGPVTAPVDLDIVAAFCHVLAVERRKMIPEGVTEVVEGGFRIYLQDNFETRPGIKRRQRFTLAHELAHTLFYDLSHTTPTLIPGAPKGERLERLCHSGAGQILIPENLLLRETELRHGVGTGEDVFELAEVFDVSTEVLVRRLHSVSSATESNFAALVVGTETGGRPIIRAACFKPWLSCIVKQPKHGDDYQTWLRPLRPNDEGNESPSIWQRSTPVGTISARTCRRSKFLFLLDLRLTPR
jgi:hypothetical protein